MFRNIIRLLFLLNFVATDRNSCYSKSIYVNSRIGKDSNSGTLEYPFFSISKALSVSHSNDTILLSANCRWFEKIVLSDKSNIHLMKYNNGENPIIDGSYIIPQNVLWQRQGSVSKLITPKIMNGQYINRLWIDEIEYKMPINNIDCDHLQKIEGQPNYVELKNNISNENAWLQKIVNYNPLTTELFILSKFLDKKIKISCNIFEDKEDKNIYLFRIYNSKKIYIQDINFEYGKYSLLISKCDNFYLKNCSIGTYSDNCGIQAIESKNVVIQSCKIDSKLNLFYSENKYSNIGTLQGIQIKKGCENWQIRDCVFDNWHHSSIFISDKFDDSTILPLSNITISGCIFKTSSISYGRAIGIYCKSARGVTGVVIENNIIYENKIQTQLGGFGTIFKNNLVYKTNAENKIKCTNAFGYNGVALESGGENDGTSNNYGYCIDTNVSNNLFVDNEGFDILVMYREEKGVSYYNNNTIQSNFFIKKNKKENAHIVLTNSFEGWYGKRINNIKKIGENSKIIENTFINAVANANKVIGYVNNASNELPANSIVYLSEKEIKQNKSIKKLSFKDYNTWKIANNRYYNSITNNQSVILKNIIIQIANANKYITNEKQNIIDYLAL